MKILKFTFLLVLLNSFCNIIIAQSIDGVNLKSFNTNKSIKHTLSKPSNSRDYWYGNMDTTKPNSWQNTFLSIYSYDANGNLTKKLRTSKSGTIWDQWLYKYDYNNNETEKMYQYLYDGGDVNRYRYVTINDSLGSIIEKRYEVWSKKSQKWITTRNANQYVYTYNLTKQPTAIIIKNFDSLNNVYNVAVRFTYTYSNGRRNTENVEIWKNGQWENNAQTTYTYDSNGKMIESVREGWTGTYFVNYDKETNITWIDSTRRSTYNYKMWKNNLWVDSLKYSYTYDNNKNTTNYNVDAYSNKVWVKYYQEINYYKYDVFNNVDSTSYIYYNYAKKAMVNSDAFKYSNYKNYIVNTNNILKEENISLYPNPVSDKFIIDIENYKDKNITVVIYDITGKKVYSKQYNNIGDYIEINTSEFNKGIYFVKVLNKDIKYNSKIVVQ